MTDETRMVFGDTTIRHSGTRYEHIGPCPDDCWHELKRLLDARTRERDEARAEVERLRAWAVGSLRLAADQMEATIASPPAEPPAVQGDGEEWVKWAVTMFGSIALNPQERALRFVEEAIELGQAAGIDETTIGKIVARVYSRPAGEITREIGQCQATLDALAYVANVDARAEATAEFTRVKSVPKDEWERRHLAKVEKGFALPAPPSDTEKGEGR